MLVNNRVSHDKITCLVLVLMVVLLYNSMVYTTWYVYM